MKKFLLIAAAALSLYGCGEPAKVSSVPHAEKIGSNGRFEVYRQCFTEVGAQFETCLYVVPNATVTYNCGKSCTRTVASPGATLDTPEAQAALSRVAPADRQALGLPPAPDARLTALAKLTPTERTALGL